MVYLAIHSLVLSIFGLFRDFAPIQMYGENEKTFHPYIGSTTILPDSVRSYVHTFLYSITQIKAYLYFAISKVS